MAGSCKVSVGPDGPVLKYRSYHVNMTGGEMMCIPKDVGYDVGDLFTCGDFHCFWNGAEWIEKTENEQLHPSDDRVFLYQRRDGSLRWKVKVVTPES
jgi:hypothetical protein